MSLQTPRPTRTPVVVAVLLLTLASATTVFAQPRENFRRGIVAMDGHQWTEVVRYMREALAEGPREGGLVRIYGNRWEPYIPNFYVGLARRALGDCPGAVSAWTASVRQGAVRVFDDEFAALERGLRACEARLAAAGRIIEPDELRADDVLRPARPVDPLDQLRTAVDDRQWAEARRLVNRLQDLRSGVQLPAEPELPPSPDIVVAEIRQSTATLVLGPSLEGRVVVRNEQREIVVEFQKARGRRLEVGLEPGVYEVRVERDGATFVATSEIAKGERLLLGMDPIR